MTISPPVTVSTTTPVWLLDVDGVINARRPAWDQPPDHGLACVEGVTYRLRWAPALTLYLRAVHQQSLVELRWATTWVDHVGQVEHLLRLPPLPTAFCNLGTAPAVAAPEQKLAAALRVVEEEQRPLIWTDDDAIPVRGRLRHRLEHAGVPVLLLAPDPFEGLAPHHLQWIDTFIGDVLLGAQPQPACP